MAGTTLAEIERPESGNAKISRFDRLDLQKVSLEDFLRRNRMSISKKPKSLAEQIAEAEDPLPIGIHTWRGIYCGHLHI